MSEMPSDELRARVHEVLDPLWLTAIETSEKPKNIEKMPEAGKKRVVKIARERVYHWLAEQMWLDEKECHISRFSVEQCEDAIRLLRGITYREIRRWARARGLETEAQKRFRLRQGAAA